MEVAVEKYSHWDFVLQHPGIKNFVIEECIKSSKNLDRIINEINRYGINDLPKLLGLIEKGVVNKETYELLKRYYIYKAITSGTAYSLLKVPNLWYIVDSLVTKDLEFISKYDHLLSRDIPGWNIWNLLPDKEISYREHFKELIIEGKKLTKVYGSLYSKINTYIKSKMELIREVEQYLQNYTKKPIILKGLRTYYGIYLFFVMDEAFEKPLNQFAVKSGFSTHFSEKFK